MNLQDVVKTFGAVSKAPQKIPTSNKNGNLLIALFSIAIGAVGIYFLINEIKRKNEPKKKFTK